jgi:hypothetical protein
MNICKDERPCFVRPARLGRGKVRLRQAPRGRPARAGVSLHVLGAYVSQLAGLHEGHQGLAQGKGLWTAAG